MKIKNIANFNGKYVTADDNTVYLRIDYGGFYEWYEKSDKRFSMLEVTDSKELEECFEKYKSSRDRNVININGKR